MGSNLKDQSNKDLLVIERQQAYEEKEAKETEEMKNMSKDITVKVLEELLRTIEKAEVVEIDSNSWKNR